MKSHIHNIAADLSLRERMFAVCCETSWTGVSAPSRNSLVIDRSCVGPYGGGAMQ